MTIYYDKVGTFTYKDSVLNIETDMRVRIIEWTQKYCDNQKCLFRGDPESTVPYMNRTRCRGCDTELKRNKVIRYKAYLSFDRRIDPMELLKGYNTTSGGPLFKEIEVLSGSIPPLSNAKLMKRKAPLELRAFSKGSDKSISRGWRPQRKTIFAIFRTYEDLEKFLRSIRARGEVKRRADVKGKMRNAEKCHPEVSTWTLHKIPSQAELEQAYKKWEQRRMIDRM